MPGKFATLEVIVTRTREYKPVILGLLKKCFTKAVALWSRGAGDGCEAGSGIETSRFSASPLAGLLNDVDGVRLEGQTHIDLDYASRAGDRRDSR